MILSFVSYFCLPFELHLGLPTKGTMLIPKFNVILGNPIQRSLLDTLSLILLFFFCRSTLRLESLEDAVVLESEDDLLSDKHGCPAYVSPEILRTNSQYSGRAADMWGLGVMLYTMLVGRYVFT